MKNGSISYLEPDHIYRRMDRYFDIVGTVYHLDRYIYIYRTDISDLVWCFCLFFDNFTVHIARQRILILKSRVFFFVLLFLT